MRMPYQLTEEELQIEYFQELEDEWRKTQPKFTDTYLVEIFPDAIDEFDEKFKELKVERKMLIEEINTRIQPYANREDMDALFAKFCIKEFLIKDLVKIEENLFFLQRLKRKKNPQKYPKKKGLTDEDIERARNFSIVAIAEAQLERLRKKGKSYTAKCTFHEDKTPSLVLYEDSNRFHCFGCQASGDVITFVQKLFNYDFKQAVYYLIH